MNSRKKKIFEIVVRAIIIFENRLLINVRSGRYAFLPGGKVNHGETLQEALIREIKEEVHTVITPGQLYLVGENFYRQKFHDIHELGFYFLVSTAEPLFPLDQERPNPDAPDLIFRYVSLTALQTVHLLPRPLCKWLTPEMMQQLHPSTRHCVLSETASF